MNPRAVLLVLLVALLSAGGGMAARAADTADDLSAWTLPVPGATASSSNELTTDMLLGCLRGHENGWTTPDGDTSYLLWAECTDHDQAGDFGRLYQWRDGFVPATPATTPADENETTAVPRGAGVVRMWTQGPFALILTTYCQSAGCPAASADWAADAATRVAGPRTALPDPRPLTADLFADWQPEGVGWTLIRAVTPSQNLRDGCADGALQEWLGDGGTKLEVWWTRCDTTDFAFAFQRRVKGTTAATTALPHVFGATYDRVEEQTDLTGDTAVDRSWVQGRTFASVYLSCPGDDAATCAARAAGVVTSLSPLLPGEVQADSSGFTSLARAGWLLLGGPLLLFVLLLAPSRLRGWWQTRGYSVIPAGPRFASVDRMVRPVRAGRILRRLLVTAAALVTWFTSLLWLNGSLWVLLPAFFGLFVLIPLYNLLLRLVWRRHELITLGRRRPGRGVGAAAGALVRGGAVVVAVLSLVAYGLGAMMLVIDSGQLPVDTEESIRAGLASSDPFALAWAALHQVAHWLDGVGAPQLLFVFVLLVPMTAAYLLDRLGQRLGRRSLTALLQKDDRPYFVYLRGFDEDRLRIRESAGRQGFLELFTPFGRPRFEEVLVHYLSLYGPVVAISPRRQRIPDLGAAKVSLSDDSWQAQIRDWVGGARAVVMSATPGEVRAGLEWEMAHVAARSAELRLLLVLAPWPRVELRRRWQGFLAHADGFPPFAELRGQAFPEGLEIATWSAERGWHGYGARRRWDWTYAASIVTAIRNGDLGSGAGSDDAAAPAEPRQADTVSP